MRLGPATVCMLTVSQFPALPQVTRQRPTQTTGCQPAPTLKQQVWLWQSARMQDWMPCVHAACVHPMRCQEFPDIARLLHDDRAQLCCRTEGCAL